MPGVDVRWSNAGGDDFDNVIVEWLIDDHLKMADVVRSPVAIARLKALAESAKVGAAAFAILP